MQLSRRGNRNVKAASFCLPALMFRVSTGGQSQAAFLFSLARTPAEPELVRHLRASGVRQGRASSTGVAGEGKDWRLLRNAHQGDTDLQ